MDAEATSPFLRASDLSKFQLRFADPGVLPGGLDILEISAEGDVGTTAITDFDGWCLVIGMDAVVPNRELACSVVGVAFPFRLVSPPRQ